MTLSSPLQLTVPPIILFKLLPFNPFPNNKFWTPPKGKSLQITIVNLMKMAENYRYGIILREKEKLLITSNFSFSHFVFKRLVLQTHKNKGLFGKGLIPDSANQHFLHLPSIMSILSKNSKIQTYQNQAPLLLLFTTQSQCLTTLKCW